VAIFPLELRKRACTAGYISLKICSGSKLVTLRQH
jgi:hypothetical protein